MLQIILFFKIKFIPLKYLEINFTKRGRVKKQSKAFERSVINGPKTRR